jgi:hypothetical protein
MRAAASPAFLLAFSLLIYTKYSIAYIPPDNESPDLLQKAPDHLLKNFLASPDAEPGTKLFH